VAGRTVGRATWGGGRGRFISAGVIGIPPSGLSATINQVTETDLAQAIAIAPKRRLVNQVTETDLAQALTHR
jgi:hypothetical protein